MQGAEDQTGPEMKIVKRHVQYARPDTFGHSLRRSNLKRHELVQDDIDCDIVEVNLTQVVPLEL